MATTVFSGRIGNNLYNILQSDFSGLDIIVADIRINPEVRPHRHYYIPVRVKPGFSWKLNTASVANDTGSASDLLDLFSRFPAYANATIKALILENRNRKRLEWRY